MSGNAVAGAKRSKEEAGMRRRAGPRGGTDHGRIGRIWIRQAVAAASLITGVVLLSIVAHAQLLDVSGRFSLDTVMMPIPVTLIDEIKLDTPAELTLLKFGAEATLDFTASYNNLSMHFNSAINFAGLERAIFEFDIPFGPLTVSPELWFAVPFETVTDVNHFSNCVVIPPGDLLFVKTRWTFTTSYGGLDFKLLFLLEDVEFPVPSMDFEPLFYSVQSQSFRYGAILTITAEPYPGVSLTSVTNINADGGANMVKGHSAPGRAYRDCDPPNESWFNETITVTGLQYCNIPFWVSMRVDPCAIPLVSFRGGGSFSTFAGMDLSGSISLFPISISGFSFSAEWCDCVRASINISETFNFEKASLHCSADIPFGLMRGTISWNGTLVAGKGLTGFSVGTSVNQGTFTGSLNVSISDQQGMYRLSSVTTRLTVNQAPLALTTSITFGKTGLRRAVIGVGVVF